MLHSRMEVSEIKDAGQQELSICMYATPLLILMHGSFCLSHHSHSLQPTRPYTVSSSPSASAAMSSSNLQFTPCVLPMEGNEINFTNLYLHHTHSGPEQNQFQVVSTFDKITGCGYLVINNWTVYDGIGSNARLVAHAKGLHVYADKWHNSFSLLFTDDRYICICMYV